MVRGSLTAVKSFSPKRFFSAIFYYPQIKWVPAYFLKIIDFGENNLFHNFSKVTKPFFKSEKIESILKNTVSEKMVIHS